MPKKTKKVRKAATGQVLKKGESMRKNGTYVYTYTDPDGKRKFVYAPDYMTLVAKRKQLEKDQLDGIRCGLADQMSVNVLFDRYIALKVNLRITTKTNYIYMYNHFVRDTLGKRSVSSVRYSDIKQFYIHLLKEGLGYSTLDTINNVLQPTFEMAVRDDIIRKNPVTGVKRELGESDGKNKGVRHALTLEQQQTFLDYIDDHPVFGHWKNLFVFLLGTGVRIGEGIGLRWEDVDWENQIININHSIVYYTPTGMKGKSVLMVSMPKTKAGCRDIPLLEQVHDALQDEWTVQKEMGYNQTVIDGMSGFIFTNRNGNVHNPQTINRTIKRIVTQYNSEEVVDAAKHKREPFLLPVFSCHILRHTFCTRLCEAESNLKVIQDIMGHANIETTMDIYAEATMNAKKEAIGQLSLKLNME